MTSSFYKLDDFRRAILHFIGGRFVQAVARAILLLVLVRLLSDSDYGAYMLIVGISELLLEPATFGLVPVSQRYIPEIVPNATRQEATGFVGRLIGLQMLAIAVVVAVFYVFRDSLGQSLNLSGEQVAAAGYGLLLFLLVPAFRFAAEVLEALLQQGRAQTCRASMPLGRAAGIGLLVVAGCEINLQTLFILDAAVTLGCLLMAWRFIFSTLCARLASHREVQSYDSLPLADMCRFGWHMSLAGLLNVASAPGAIRIVISATLGTVETGLFAFLQSTQRMVSRYLPGILLRGLVRPMLISRYMKEKTTAVLRSGVNLLGKSNLVIVAIACVTAFLAGDEIVTVLSGGRFVGAGHLLTLLFIGLLFQSQRALINMSFQITGHTSAIRIVALVSPLILMLALWFADHGLQAVVMVLVCGSGISIALAAWLLSQKLNENLFDVAGMVGVLLVATCSAAAGAAASHYGPAQYSLPVAATVFCLGLLIVKPLRADEIDVVGKAGGNTLQRVAAFFARTGT